MKKMFAASLVAIMAVSAANAEIASVSYTDKAITEKTGDISALKTTANSNLTAAVNELADKITDTGSDATDAINAAKTELQGSIDAVDDKADANAAAIDALDATYATDTALTNGLALKEDAANKTTSFDDTSASDVKFPSTSAVTSYVSAATSTINTNIEAVQTALAGKQATIADLETIRSNAAAGAAAEANAKAYTDAEVKELAEGAVADNTAAISSINNAETGILAQAKADAASKDTALETKITGAYTAADTALETSLKQYADDKAAAASGSAADVADDLAEYIQSNNTAVNAAKAQADKGVADAAAAQAAANANAAAIEGLDTTYVSESEMSSFKTSNTSAIATAKSEAIAAAKTAGDAAYDAKGAAAAAQTAAVNAAKSAADATYQVKSSALSVGAANGAWTDLTKATGYSATGTHSLVLKNGTIQWEAVRYAE